MVVFFLLHSLVTFIGLFVDASIWNLAVSPVNDYKIVPTQVIEMILMIPLTLDFVLRMMTP
jgi:hypothetical protein